MTISEGDDNLIKCNKIPSESAVSESLAYFTRSNSETNRVCNVDIHCYRKRKKKDLTGNKKNAFFMPLHKSDKKRKTWQIASNIPCRKSHCQKGGQNYISPCCILQTISATVVANNQLYNVDTTFFLYTHKASYKISLQSITQREMVEFKFIK